MELKNRTAIAMGGKPRWVEAQALIDEYDFVESREKYIARMREGGYAVVYPTEYELQLDIDTQAQYDQFLTLYPVLAREFATCSYVEWASKSGGIHICVRMPIELTNTQRLALQACLGSDPLRELLGLVRESYGIENPTLFSEPMTTQQFHIGGKKGE